MAYSKAKPYNRVNYKGAVDPSYDRYLKEAEASGNITNTKESELEKPYNKKQTYSAMQQDYNPVTPPTIDPGPGTGGLKCVWTSTGCEQLVGCWAGSDIKIDGPKAATAGYMHVNASVGEIVKQTISGSEGRGIEIILNPLVSRNSFIVTFKDGNGVNHNKWIDIECIAGVTYFNYASFDDGSFGYHKEDGVYTTGANALLLAYDYKHVDSINHYKWSLLLTFELDNVPAGATINTAYISLYKDTTATIVTATAKIYTYDLDNGKYPWYAFNLSTLENDIAYPVDWTIAEYGTSVADKTEIIMPSIVTGVQAVVNRVGYSMGNKISFFIKPQSGDAETPGYDTFIEPAFGDPLYAAVLHLDFF